MKRKKTKKLTKSKPSKKDIELLKTNPELALRKAGINVAQLIKQLRDIKRLEK